MEQATEFALDLQELASNLNPEKFAEVLARHQGTKTEPYTWAFPDGSVAIWCPIEQSWEVKKKGP